ncbi:MAG: ribonuclease HII [Pseudomonadota bacterium]|mgnify:CR=1 FL=1
MIIVGIDEAGRGPLAGPVVSAAVILEMSIDGIDDSKKLSAEKRGFLYDEILSKGKIGVGIASVEEIDEINILNATMLSMERAYYNLNIEANLILVDGNKAPKIKCEEVKVIVGGDAIEYVISAASIIAKVTRDRIMHELDLIHPEYMWKNNAGYGTKAHIEAIEKYGITQYHRRSFSPIRGSSS